MLNKKILAIIISLAFLGSNVLPASSALAYKNNTLTCGDYSVEIKSVSTGLVGWTNLNISEPQVIEMNTKESCAVVVWNTNYISTSQVIFAKEGESRTLDILNSDAGKFWGYSRGSEQNNDPQAYHIMIIKGLQKGSTYYLRAVSRPHEYALPFVSKEIKFVFTDKYNKTKYYTSSNLARNTKSVNKTNQYKTSNKIIKTSKNTFNNAQYQILQAQKINRKMAPAHSSGKFVLSVASEGVKSKSIKQALDSKVNNEISSGKTKDEWKEKLANDIFGDTNKENQTEKDELVGVISASGALESSKGFWVKLWEWLKSVLGFNKNSDNTIQMMDETSVTDNTDKLQNDDSYNDDNLILKNTDKSNTENAEKSDGLNYNLGKSAALGGLEQQNLNYNFDKDYNKTQASSAASFVDGKVAEGLDNLANATVAGSSKIADFINALGILALVLPVLLILVALYIIQHILVQFDKLQKKNVAYWLASFAIFAIVFFILKITPVALMFLALFLIALAWHLFNVAISDIDTNVQDVEVEKNDN